MQNTDVTDLSDAVIKGRLRTLGISYEDLNKPIIAIANTYNEIALPHRKLLEIAQYVKLGIAEAGGIGLEFNTIAMCDGIAQGLEGMKYVLPSREIIADSIEAMVKGHPIFSGLVCIGACDKTIPGMLIAAARLNIPTIVISGGPVVSIGKKGVLDEKLVRRNVEDYVFSNADFKEKGFWDDYIYEEDYIKQCYLKGIISKSQLIEYYADALSTCGLCTSLATANTMGILAEVLGMSIPECNITPLVLNEKVVYAKKAGKAIVEAIKKRLTPRKIITKASLDNAIAIDMAIGGSMNSILHLIALAHELNIEIAYDDFERIGKNVPFIVDVKPNGKYNIIELYRSGGVRAVEKEIAKFLNLDAINIQGHRLMELLEDVENLNQKVIHKVDDPIREKESIIVLRGNIAKEGSIAKTVIMDGVEEFKGRANVFECDTDFWEAAIAGEIEENSVIVVRNEGPLGGPGMSEGHRISEAIRAINSKSIALITDGRFSGATVGIVVGYISPEAYSGGEISLIENDDLIYISIKERKIELLVSNEEMNRRRNRKKKYVRDLEKTNYLKKYRYEVQTAIKGASTKIICDGE